MFICYMIWSVPITVTCFVNMFSRCINGTSELLISNYLMYGWMVNYFKPTQDVEKFSMFEVGKYRWCKPPLK